jgi:hypothetical protein
VVRGALDTSAFRQLGDVRRNPSRLIFAEQLVGRAPPRLVLEIDIRKLLRVLVADHKAGVQFFDRPGGWKPPRQLSVQQHDRQDGEPRRRR